MIVVNRFRVTDADGLAFHAAAEPAVALLRTKAGLQSVDLVQNLDEPDLWALVTRWDHVGAYRRALGGFESKMTLVPFLSRSIDEPSAYDAPEHVGENLPRVR
ncbi:antibiotic biosynthesis monooxygenase family protein [Mariniluteicoccus flavus]